MLDSKQVNDRDAINILHNSHSTVNTLIINLIISKKLFEIRLNSYCYHLSEYVLTVHDNDTIREVKENIARINPDVEPDFIALGINRRGFYFFDTGLKDDQTLESYKIEPFWTLRVEKFVLNRLHFNRYSDEDIVEFQHVIRPHQSISYLKNEIIWKKNLKKKTIELVKPRCVMHINLWI